MGINLEQIMKIIIHIFVIICILSCAKTNEKKNIERVNPSITTDTAFINGTLLELVDKNGKAELLVHSTKYKKVGSLKTSTSSLFLKRNNKVLSYSYADVGVDYTIIIQGKTGIQGVLFKKDSIIMGRYYTLSSLYNTLEGADEKLYWDFAHSN